MSTSTPLRAEAVAASVLAGSFLVLGHLLNAGAGEAGTVAGTALVRAESTPASAGVLLIVGTLVFAGGTVAGRFADPVTVAGAFLTGLGLVALGVALARRPETPAPRDVVAPTRH